MSSKTTRVHLTPDWFHHLRRTTEKERAALGFELWNETMTMMNHKVFIKLWKISTDFLTELL